MKNACFFIFPFLFFMIGLTFQSRGQVYEKNNELLYTFQRENQKSPYISELLRQLNVESLTLHLEEKWNYEPVVWADTTQKDTLSQQSSQESNQDPSEYLKPALQLSLKKVDAEYRGFNLKPLLFPQAIDLLLLQVEDKMVMREFKALQWEQESSKRVVLEPLFTQSSEKSNAILQNLQIVIRNFSFDDNQAQKALAYLQQIDKYYTQADKLREADQILFSLQSKELAAQERENRLNQVSNTLQEAQAFKQILPLHENDPILLRKNWTRLYQAYRKEKEALYPPDLTQCQALYEQGLAKLEAGQDNSASYLFTKLLTLKYDFLPAHYQLARQAYQAGDFEVAKEHLDFIRLHLAQDTNLEAPMRALYRDMYAYFVRRANYFHKNLDFDKSFAFYDEAADICQTVNVKQDCQGELKSKIEEATLNGMEFWIAELKTALYLEDFQNACKYWRKGNAFKENYLYLLPQGNQTYQNYEQILNAEKELLQEQMRQAIDAAFQERQNLESKNNNSGKNSKTFQLVSAYISLTQDSLWVAQGFLDQAEELWLHQAAVFFCIENPALTLLALEGLADMKYQDFKTLAADLARKDFDKDKNWETEISKYGIFATSLKGFQKAYQQAWRKEEM
ncbi:hypothetical protein [Hugenholtzia roseola]|uniref:hypothetical protein n=1 Tax=Hugenholtzia roseola TaxID=1002 RepID=UPI0004210827|nr:hypothetical protein [Hugenholtzia roseola]